MDAGEVAQARVAGAVTISVIDRLEKPSRSRISNVQGLQVLSRPDGLLGETNQEMPAVGEPGQIVNQSEVGDLAAQPVDRHQHEAEIGHHAGDMRIRKAPAWNAR